MRIIIVSILATKLLLSSLCDDTENQNVPVVSVAPIQGSPIRFYESKQFRGFETTELLVNTVSQMLTLMPISALCVRILGTVR